MAKAEYRFGITRCTTGRRETVCPVISGIELTPQAVQSLMLKLRIGMHTRNADGSLRRIPLVKPVKNQRSSTLVLQLPARKCHHRRFDNSKLQCGTR